MANPTSTSTAAADTTLPAADPLGDRVWLRANLRAQLVEMILPAIIAIAGLGLVVCFWYSDDYRWLRLSGYAVLTLGAMWWGWLIYLATLPRIAYDEGFLVLQLTPPDAIAVPIEIVECFFIGQGPSAMPPVDGLEAQSVNVVVRLAEKAVEWKHRDVHTLLAHWCDGYIVIRGIWCEPLDGDLVNRLNKKLAAAHRRQRALAAAERSA